MKKLLIILIIVLLTLYLTNPALSDFEEYIERNAYNSVKASSMSSDDSFDELIGLLSGELSKAYANIATTRNEYYIYSTYTIAGIDDYYFVGIFKQFIPIPN